MRIAVATKKGTKTRKSFQHCIGIRVKLRLESTTYTSSFQRRLESSGGGVVWILGSSPRMTYRNYRIVP